MMLILRLMNFFHSCFAPWTFSLERESCEKRKIFHLDSTSDVQSVLSEVFEDKHVENC